MRPTTVMEAESDQAQSKTSQSCGRPDTLYLFACHLHWETYGDIKAYQVLITALDSYNEEVRMVAEALLRRRSPRPKSCSKSHAKAIFAGQEHQQCPS